MSELDEAYPDGATVTTDFETMETVFVLTETGEEFRCRAVDGADALRQFRWWLAHGRAS